MTKPNEPKPSCCNSNPKNTQTSHQEASHELDMNNCCGGETKQRIDYLLWCSGAFVLITYILSWVWPDSGLEILDTMTRTSQEMTHAMWWGIVSAAVFVGLLSRIPQSVIISILGKGGTFTGLVRATMAGVLLDLCNHGILMIAMQLYKRGASIGQVVAFLVASPWNSLTLTLILVGLIGLPLTLAFIGLSVVIALSSGWLFDWLVARKHLPENVQKMPESDLNNTPIIQQINDAFATYDWHLAAWGQLFMYGLKESKMVLRWVLFGVVMVAFVRAFMPPESFGVWFGASVSGLFLTLLATTVLEVCSEGSSPIAADLVTRANAPGNAFTFLMAGASTDYTEIMAIKDTTKSWRIALCLPLLTVPQVLLIGWLLNGT